MKISLRSERGQTLVWVALFMLVLLGFAALAIDAGNLYNERRRMQNAADGAALAGAEELCLGRSGSAAIAMANDYATRNGAQWATPVPHIVSSANVSITVTAGRTSDTLIAEVLGSSSAVVAAQASARCESPSMGVPTFPITLLQSQYDALNCGDTIYITVENTPNLDPCPSGCDCAHVFNADSTVDENSERGWFVESNICGTGTSAECSPLSSAMPWGTCNLSGLHVGSCVNDKTGASMGAFGGANGKDLTDWVRSAPGGVRRVVFPLFDYFGPACNGVSGCQGYRVSGFACVDLTNGNEWQKKDEWPSLPGQECEDDKGKPIPLSKAIVGTVNCNCTIGGGLG
ncbi:MAG: Tad domain-containing protein, partial [Anaerolineae bacterium]|nr:Tad domain-containing protein [Anaerolineae bacterium]